MKNEYYLYGLVSLVVIYLFFRANSSGQTSIVPINTPIFTNIDTQGAIAARQIELDRQIANQGAKNQLLDTWLAYDLQRREIEAANNILGGKPLNPDIYQLKMSGLTIGNN